MEGCQWKASSQKNLRVHFSHQHSQDSIVILEEGNQPHLRFPQCDMFFPQEALYQVHTTSAMCWRRTERKLWRLVVEETEEQMVQVLAAYGTPLMAVSSF